MGGERLRLRNQRSARRDGDRELADDVPTVAEHLLQLQHRAGNSAVAELVQRQAEAEEFSTGSETYFPTEHSKSYGGWSDDELLGHGNQWLDSTAKNDWFAAAEVFKEYWFRHKDYRPIGVPLYKVYKRIGDDKQAAFWLAFSRGTSESQAGKEF